jgi:hypothetical protein
MNVSIATLFMGDLAGGSEFGEVMKSQKTQSI